MGTPSKLEVSGRKGITPTHLLASLGRGSGPGGLLLGLGCHFDGFDHLLETRFPCLLGVFRDFVPPFPFPGTVLLLTGETGNRLAREGDISLSPALFVGRLGIGIPKPLFRIPCLQRGFPL